MAGCATRRCFRRERGSRNVDIARRREGCACPSAPPLSTAAPPVRHEQATSAGMADRTGLSVAKQGPADHRRGKPPTRTEPCAHRPASAESSMVAHPTIAREGRRSASWAWPMPSCRPSAQPPLSRGRDRGGRAIVEGPRSCLGGWCNRRVAGVAPAGPARDGAASPERIPCPCGKGPALLLRPP